MSLAALLLTAALAQADVPLPPPPPGTTWIPASEEALPAPPPPPPPRESPALPRFGLSLGAGFPHGAALGLVYRPAPAVRLWAGPAWNYASFGLHAGAAIQPWRLAVSPVLSAEAGRYFSSDVSFAAKDASGVPEELAPLLEDVRYAYGAVHLGLEVGSPTGLSFSLGVGLAYVSIQATGTARATEDTGGSTATVEFDDPRLRGTLPSVKLGLQYWF
jgi:hypothetical protein